MDYRRIYDELIQRAKSQNRKKFEGIYYEYHHIIPKCVNGNDDRSNKVLLTAREHFIAHKLLVEIYPNNVRLARALWMISHAVKTGNGYREGMKITSRDYERIRELIATTPITEEHRKNLRTSHLGIPSAMKGKHFPPEVVDKNRKAQTGKKATPMAIEKRRRSMMGKNAKPILQFDKDGNFIKEWHSTNEASRQLGIGDSGIWKAMNGERKYFGGFIWKYK